MQFSRKNLALLTDLNFKFTDAVARLQWAQYWQEGPPMTRIIMWS